MATIALPRLSLPSISLAPLQGLIANRYLRLGAASLLLAAAVFGLVKTVSPANHDPNEVRLSLSAALARAPEGWRQTLNPLRGPARVSQDVIRLSERPLAPLTGASWNKPGRAVAPPPPGAPLPVAPIAGFFAPGPAGPLPIISQDGRTP
ncbi:MAG TPA: divergent polysaccharide deacetylase family protein, partial [Caulobacteraceae bacterium]|nr:divergent polysaccharide deacetylase family protein [Caulobacteraceae bacterium]